MKKKYLAALLMGMAFTMTVTAAGCGKKQEEASVPETEVVAEIEPTEVVEETEITEEVTEEPAEAVTEESVEVSDGYTYEEMDSTMYAAEKINVRSTPSQDGEKLGTLKKGEAVKVTGKCVETGWFRVAYGDGNGFVSDKYVTETAASGTTNSASSSKDGKKDSKSNGTASSTTGKQQNTGSTTSGGQSTGTKTGGKTNSSATSTNNSSNSSNNQSANNNSGNNGSSNNGNAGNSNTGNSGSGNNGASSNNGGGNNNSGNNGGSSNNGNSGNNGSTSGLPSLEEAEKKANGGAVAPGQYVDKDGKVWEVAPTLPADTENNDVSFGDSSNWDNFGENVPENP